MKREEGYYWCKLDDEWHIFTYCGHTHWYDGMGNHYKDNDFDEIGNNRIVEPK